MTNFKRRTSSESPASPRYVQRVSRTEQSSSRAYPIGQSQQRTAHIGSSTQRSSRDNTISQRAAQDAQSFDRISPSIQMSSRLTNSQNSQEEMAAYSRTSQRDYSQRKKQSKRRKIIAGVVAVCVALLVSGVAFAWSYINDISNRLAEGVDDDLRFALSEAPAPGEPFYMLLMGVDRSEERAADEENGDSNFRSDSMILARIDSSQKQVTLISLHRDTLIDMGELGVQKLNAAHQIGGAAYTVETVSKFAGVPISHYAEIDFDSFKAIVDALGGVEVDVPMEINDDDAGGHVDAGLQTLNGDQALILARARHAYDEFGDGDVYRAANQRMILGAIAQKILASDLPTIAKTVSMAADYIVTDMTIDEIIKVAQCLRGMDTSKDIYSIMEPTEAVYMDGGWYEYVNEPAWRAIISRVDQGLPPVADEEVYANNGGITDGSLDKDFIAQNALSSGNARSPQEVKTPHIDVYNGNGIGGAASVAADLVKGAGFAVGEVGNADSSDHSQTLIVYNNEADKADAQKIAAALGVGATFKNDGSYSFTGRILVIVGQDF